MRASSHWRPKALVPVLLFLVVIGLWSPGLWRTRDLAPAPGPAPLVGEAIAQSSPAEPAEPRQPSEAEQGPGLIEPREIFTMLNQRRRYLDERERALKAEEARLAAVKQEIQSLLSRNQEVLEQIEDAERQGRSSAAARQAEAEQREREARQRAAAREEAEQARAKQVAKIYEAMPPEEAATRMEKLPTKTALQVLRLLKSRAAGNILAEVNPDKAAKLTEQYLSQ